MNVTDTALCCFMLMDATSAANIPGYVTGTHLPQWLLPTVAPDK